MDRAGWVQAAKASLLPFSPEDWHATSLAAAVQVPGLTTILADQQEAKLRAMVTRSSAARDAKHTGRALVSTARERAQLVGKAILEVGAGTSCEDGLARVATLLTERQLGAKVVTTAADVASIVLESPADVRRATQEAFATRFAKDAAWMADLMRRHPKLSVEELRRIFAQNRPHMTADYCRALPFVLDESGAITQVRKPQWPERDVDRMGPEPHFLFAAQLAYQLLDAPEGANYESVLRSWRATWYGYWNHNECMAQDYQHADLLTPLHIERLHQAYPFIPLWPDGKRPHDALTLEDLRTAVYKRQVGIDPADARFIATQLEDLRKIPLYEEEYRWYAWKTRPIETGALAGAVQVETEQGINDKFAAKRFEILVDKARGSDTYNIIKHYSADDGVIDVLQRCLGIHVERADPDNIAALTKT